MQTIYNMFSVHP